MVYDVSLYGHITIDTIFGDSKDYSFGGIANIWRALKKCDSDLLINLEPTYYGEAIIYIDKIKSSRYSDALLNLKSFTPKISPSKINMISYINELDDKKFIGELKGFNIADVCKGKEVTGDMLKNIDLLLIADEDVTNLQEIKRDFFGILLVHGPDRSTIYFGKEKVETILEKENFVENLNVLGAGDIFAAVLIYYLLQNKFEDSFDIETFFLKIKKNIDTIHQKTTKILIDYN